MSDNIKAVEVCCPPSVSHLKGTVYLLTLVELNSPTLVSLDRL